MPTLTPELEERAKQLRDQLTLDEKVRMLSGSKGFYNFILGSAASGEPEGAASAADVPRLDLKGFVYSDGPRGITKGACTCFPVPMARAATFSPELEERVGEAVGREARAVGVNLVLAPCINLLRHPAWGRAQETYGEDPGLLADMGVAFTRGVQKHALACVKHFACNSIEDSRLKVDVRIGEEALHKAYLPAFEQVVRAGVASVMCAYNSVNGLWCSQNRRLLTDTLKQRWSFDGFVVSDWLVCVHDGPAALRAGLDLEMPSPVMLGKRLLHAIKRGHVPLERVDDAVLRLIRQQLRAAEMGDGRYGAEVIACHKHRALAREVATRAMVLLRNEPVRAGGAGAGGTGTAAAGAPGTASATPVLPLNAKKLKRLAVIGRLADQPNLGDRGSSGVNPPSTVTPLEGLRAALKRTKAEVVYDDGSNPKRAAALAAGCDAAVVVVGYDHDDEGESLGAGLPLWLLRRLPWPPMWALKRIAKRMVMRQMLPQGFGRGGDRRSLTLHPKDEDLLLAVTAANPRTVAAVIAGSAVLMERWREVVPAILMVWYPGMEGGHALADILLGTKKPTGRLPFAVPTSEAHLPPFDRKAKVAEYGPLHGQALIDHLGVQAAFPFGFGLTYE
jgi:beta-glucosidase